MGDCDFRALQRRIDYGPDACGESPARGDTLLRDLRFASRGPVFRPGDTARPDVYWQEGYEWSRCCNACRGSVRPDEERLSELKITPRELEILRLIAEGLSTREIADKLLVSESTVKTHSGRLFDKLGAKRRTQAVQLAKIARLIP